MAAAVRKGECSAEELVAQSLQRLRTAASTLNACTLLRDEQALESARRVDHEVHRGEAVGPLAGVPFAAKDLTPTAGDLTTRGSWSTGDWIPDRSALVVQRLEAAGAILVAKTTTPEFGFSSFTSSPRWGATANPFDRTRTSGGSSGGAAVVVACGAVPFAEGTDMGGSVRIPAAFCNVVGFKPSLGRIPMTILPSVFDNLAHFGPLARSVDDVVAFMAATAGPSDEDIQSSVVPFETSRTWLAGVIDKRIALSIDLGYYAVQPEVEAAVRSAVDRLRKAGVRIDEVPIGWTREVNDRWLDLWSVFMSAYFGDSLAEHRSHLDPRVVLLMEHGQGLRATSYKRIELLRTAMWRRMAEIFNQYDVLLTPTCAVLPPLLEKTDADYDATLPDGRYAGLDMTCPFNMVPQCPALSLPLGSLHGGPVGLQLVGRRFADEDVLATARAFEAVLSGA